MCIKIQRKIVNLKYIEIYRLKWCIYLYMISHRNCGLIKYKFIGSSLNLFEVNIMYIFYDDMM